MSDSASETAGSTDMDDTVVRPAYRDDDRPTLAQRVMAERPAASRAPEPQAGNGRRARPADIPQHRGPSRPSTEQRGPNTATAPAPARPQGPVRQPDARRAQDAERKGDAGRTQDAGRASATGPGQAAGEQDAVRVGVAQAERRSRRPSPQAVGGSSPAAAVAPAAAVGHPTQTHRHAGPSKGAVRRTRKARLRLSRIDPWSVMKTAFMFSIAAGIVLLVAVYAVWGVIEASGLFQAVDTAIQDAVGTRGDTTPFRLEAYINTPRVMGAAALIAVVDVVLITALTTLASFLYNLTATVLGGLEVTLAED